jgi:hypothetical protein
MRRLTFEKLDFGNITVYHQNGDSSSLELIKESAKEAEILCSTLFGSTGQKTLYIIFYDDISELQKELNYAGAF